jgi:hypothetical protein
MIRPHNNAVIAGLDPAIHLFLRMDCRVSPFHGGPAMTWEAIVRE